MRPRGPGSARPARSASSGSRILLDLFLGPLDAGKDGDTLRATLRAYHAVGGNSASAAASLGADRQTVRRRLHRIEDLLGRPLVDCRVEMEMALRVER